MDEESVEELSHAGPEVPGNVTRHFANVVRIATTISDISLLFGSVYPVGLQGEDSQGRGECLVHMSPQAAKSLFLLLRDQLRKYEERWELKIPVHPDMADKYGADL